MFIQLFSDEKNIFYLVGLGLKNQSRSLSSD